MGKDPCCLQSLGALLPCQLIKAQLVGLLMLLGIIQYFKKILKF